MNLAWYLPSHVNQHPVPLLHNHEAFQLYVIYRRCTFPVQNVWMFLNVEILQVYCRLFQLSVQALGCSRIQKLKIEVTTLKPFGSIGKKLFCTIIVHFIKVNCYCIIFLETVFTISWKLLYISTQLHCEVSAGHFMSTPSHSMYKLHNNASQSYADL